MTRPTDRPDLEGAPVKIEAIQSFIANGKHFVAIHADDGTVGAGQSGCWAYPVAVDAVIKTFARYLIGKDPILAAKLRRVFGDINEMHKAAGVRCVR